MPYDDTMEHRYHYCYFVKPDNRRISAKLYYPFACRKDDDRKYPLAVFSPGFNTSYRQLEHYGPYFARRGTALLLFDFCGGCLESESDGYTNEMSVLTETDDLLFVLAELRKTGLLSTYSIDPDHIFLMGESQGGYVSVLSAVRSPVPPAGVILWYPAFCLQDMALAWRKKPGGFTREMWSVPLGKKYTDDAADTDIYGEVRRCPCPGLIIHGSADRIVPISYSEKALKRQAAFVMEVIPGAAHGFEGEDRTAAADASLHFIEEHC